MGLKIAFFIIAVLPLVAWGKGYFTAAVFEHRPRHEGLTEFRDMLESNLKFYEKAARLASQKGADIILFNEFSLYPYKPDRKYFEKFADNVPDPRTTDSNPCTDGKSDAPILSILSCMARKNNIYVVADLVSREFCDGSCDAQVKDCEQKCSDNGVLLYNAAVAFDRKGKLLARYYKSQPWFEVTNSPEEPEFVTFDTEFGRFGLFICFDSVFSSSKDLVRDYGVDTVAFPTWWFEDCLPFNAVEWQQSWAIANGVNFLAANTQTPGTGSLGSGIYSKDLGALVYTYEPDGESKLLMAKVPTSRLNDSTDFSSDATVTVIQEKVTYQKDETGDRFPETGFETVAGPAMDRYKDYRIKLSQAENYTLTRLVKAEDTIQSCQNGFCCKLNYEVESEDGTMSEEYYLGAFSGLNNAGGFFHWCEETCLLVRCDPFGDKVCASQPSTAGTVFKHLKLSADFTSELVFPTVTMSKFRLAQDFEWDFDHEGPTAALEFETDSDQALLKAGLLGRCYDKDPPFVPFYPHY